MAKKDDTFCCPVKYGGMSPGDDFSNLGIQIPKGSKPGMISPQLAEHYFPGARCQVTLSIDPNASAEGANSADLFENAEKTIEATCDIKGYRSTAKSITAKLTFNNEEVEPADLLEFRKSSGYMQVQRLGDVPEKKRGRPDGNNRQATFEDEGDEE